VTGPEHVQDPEPTPGPAPVDDPERVDDPAPQPDAGDPGVTASPATTPPPPIPPPPPAVAPDRHAAPFAALAPAAAPPPAVAPSVPAPRLDDRERSLDPRMVHVWRAFSALRLVPLLLAGTVVGVLTLDAWGWVIGVGLAGLLALSLLWYQPARYARWRWRLTDLALELRRGVIVHQQETVPYFRIQQIDVIQGPVDRLLKLAALQVTTASASGSVALPGIPAADAPEVRKELLARAAEAVREHPGEVADAV
jgi:uncharacterized protein